MTSLPPAQGSGDATTDLSSASKVAIPRLDGRHSRHQEKPRQAKPRKSRTQRACDNCRKRKVRCTGEPMQCRNCVEQGATCVYSLARRDRFKEATQKNVQLIALLKELSLHVDNNGLKMIEKHLDSLGVDGPDAAPTTGSETLGKHSRESSPSDAGSDLSESFDDDADPLDEDLFQNRVTKATGFVGSNSSVQWLRSLKTRIRSTVVAGLGHPASHSQHLGKTSLQHGSNLRVSSSTFYLDDDDLPLDVIVDPYQLPPPATAERLFDYYMKTTHASFPILPNAFEEQFRKWNESRQSDRDYQVPAEWQAMLNLVLAIGAQYAHLVQAEDRADERDDVIYMTRACQILRLDKMAISLPAPSLTFIQALGLLSLYYLTIGHVSRAWMMVGISLRFALAAGLHLRNDNPSAILNAKETLIRTWWSLHSIESLLCAIIGRPCVIPNDECTVPLPQIVLKKPSVTSDASQPRDSARSSRGDPDTITRSSFLGARVTIALILQKALAKLYSPELAVDSWDRIQSNITPLLSEIDEWAVAARLADLSPANSFEESGIERAKLILSFHYYSAKLLICRPCLCRTERHNKGQSDSSADFDQRTADMCVESAQAITRLLPDQVDLRVIYEQGPWWCIVHNIMQAIAVFLLKMSIGRLHSLHDGKELSESVKKLTRWLLSMSATNSVADRACQVVLDIIRSSALPVCIDISDITSDQNTNNTETNTDSASARPSQSTLEFSDPAFSPYSPPQPRSQQPNTANLSPHSFSTPTSWSPQDPYTTAPTTISATQLSNPPGHYTSSTASTTNHTQFLTPQSEKHTAKQDLIQQQLSMPQQNLTAQYPAQQPYENYQFHPDFALDAGMQMPFIFGNPFLTKFDHEDVLAGILDGGISDGSIGEGMGITGEYRQDLGGEYAQGMGGGFRQ